MVVIKKVLNSSVVLVEDERNVELILLGKGVGLVKNEAILLIILMRCKHLFLSKVSVINNLSK